MSYQRSITRTRQAGPFLYENETVDEVRSCEFEARRSGGLTWAVIRIAREFHQLAEFRWMDQYKIYFNEGDLRFVGHLAGIGRSALGGEMELTLLSPVLFLDRIRPFFPTSPATFPTHPDEADVAYWVKTLLDEWVVPQGNLTYVEADVPDTGVTIARPILEGRYTVAEILDTWSAVAGYWAWGVDLSGSVYFKPMQEAIQAKYNVGPDRGWGKVLSMTDCFRIGDIVNSVEVLGETPAYLDEQGRVRYPASAALFKRTVEDSASIAAYGRNRRSVRARTLRTEDQLEAFASAYLGRMKTPHHRFELVASNVVHALSPASGPIAIYDEVGMKMGEFPIENLVFSFGEDSQASIQLGTWECENAFSLLPSSVAGLDASVLGLPSSSSNPNFVDDSERHFPCWRLAVVTQVNGDGTYDLAETSNAGNVFESVSIDIECPQVSLAVGEVVVVRVPLENEQAGQRRAVAITSPIELTRALAEGSDRGPLSEIFGFDNQGLLCIKDSARIVRPNGTSAAISSYI